MIKYGEVWYNTISEVGVIEGGRVGGRREIRGKINCNIIIGPTATTQLCHNTFHRDKIYFTKSRKIHNDKFYFYSKVLMMTHKIY